MKKFIAYYRVSTQKQGDSGLGLESQKAIINHFAKDCNIIKEYIEIASGGSLEKRPQLEEAINHVLSDKNNYLIVSKADRLSRNVVDALTVYDKLEERLICCDIPNTDKFTLTIIFAVAERERLLIKIRTKEALKAKRIRENKNIINGARFHKQKPIHLKEALQKSIKIRKENSLEKNQKSIKLAKQLRNDGYSLKNIANSLNNLGFTTSRGFEFREIQVSRLLQI